MEQNGQKQFQCTGDCLKCLPVQRAYCASQHSYNTMRMMERVEQRMTEMEERFREVTRMVETMHDSEALLFDPKAEISDNPVIQTAQEGDGV